MGHASSLDFWKAMNSEKSMAHQMDELLNRSDSSKVKMKGHLLASWLDVSMVYEMDSSRVKMKDDLLASWLDLY